MERTQGGRLSGGNGSGAPGEKAGVFQKGRGRRRGSHTRIPDRAGRAAPLAVRSGWPAGLCPWSAGGVLSLCPHVTVLHASLCLDHLFS